MNQHCTIVELEQRTEAWLEWRHSGIGASDAPTIMRENPYKDYDELLIEKRCTVRGSDENAAMRNGIDLEPEALRRYISRIGKSFKGACLQSTRYTWLRASVDGLTIECDAVVEIKCGRSAYKRTVECDGVPDYYYAQTQHILAVTGLNSLDYFCYWPEYGEILRQIARDNAYIDRLLVAEQQFWTKVQNGALHGLN
jgi:putative phage-type endonuclease